MSFMSVLDKIGHEFKVALDTILPFASTAGSVAVAIYAPALGPLFNATVAVVSQTEQKFAAMGTQTGTGAQKLSEATTIIGPLVSQALTDAGKPGDMAAVQSYINSVVAILNAVPASGQAAVAPAAPHA